MIANFLLLTASALAPPTIDLEAETRRVLGLYEVSVQDLELPSLGEPILVQVELGELPFTLDLIPFTMRAPGFQLLEDKGGGLIVPADPGVERTYRGVVAEDPGSIVSGSLLPEGLVARVALTSGDVYFVQPLAEHLRAAAPSDHVVYHTADTIPRGGETKALLWPGYQDPNPPATLSVGDVYVSELAVDADFEYFNQWGSVEATLARMEANLNLVDPEFGVEAGIRHMISAAIVRTTPDPYDTTDPNSLLSRFRSEWLNNLPHLPRDQAFLFTNKNFGGLYGLGYLGSVCTSFGFSWGRADYSPLVACRATNVGHMLGFHWNAPNLDTGCWIMTNPICCTTDFSPTLSVPKMIAYRDAATCIDFEDWTALFVDDFESGDLATGGWDRSSGQRVRASAGAAYGGTTHGMRLRKGGQDSPACKPGPKAKATWAETPLIDGTGTTALEVRCRGHFVKNELDCEDLKFYWSLDGVLWNHFGTIEYHLWLDYTFPLPPQAAGQPGLRIRMVANAKGKAERAEIDDFCVLGR